MPFAATDYECYVYCIEAILVQLSPCLAHEADYFLAFRGSSPVQVIDAAGTSPAVWMTVSPVVQTKCSFQRA